MVHRAWVLAFLLVAACGDDERVSPKGGPAAPPPPAATPPTVTPPPMTPPRPPAPEAPAPGVPHPWATTRVGDWATWEIRVLATDAVTRLTWRATKVEAGRVEYSVSSKTTAPDGTTLASTETQASHDGPETDESEPVMGPKSFEIGGLRVTGHGRRRPVTGGAVEWWTSAEVPLSGLVSSVGGGVEQALVAFGRAR